MHYLMAVNVQIVDQSQNFITEIQLRGSDSFGTWGAKGFIVCTSNGKMVYWFYKTYDDRTAARQTGNWEHLFHYSANIDFDAMYMEGKWFYKGFENS
jgi:hypothetical protein